MNSWSCYLLVEYDLFTEDQLGFSVSKAVRNGPQDADTFFYQQANGLLCSTHSLTQAFRC